LLGSVRRPIHDIKPAKAGIAPSHRAGGKSMIQGLPHLSRRTLLQAGSAASLAIMARPVFGAVPGKPEKTKLKIGAPVLGASFLPLYIAADRSWKEQGLDVELVNFRSDSEATQALAGGSTDVAVVSGDGLISLVTSGQPCIGFYGGINHADFSWLSQKSIRQWEDLKGSSIGVTGFGALTDALSRYVLAKHGLAPERDVQIVPVGPGATGLQAMRAGRIGAAILAPPYNRMGELGGFDLLGTQRSEVAPEWVRAIFVARKQFLDENPETVRTVLRAHVSALRLARSDRSVGTATLASWMKLEPDLASWTYDEIMPGFDERGGLPARSMPAFWDVARQSGRVTEALPDARVFDDRFVRTFGEWAP
jgi:NitT/TauT family transport system substrate-binding protein